MKRPLALLALFYIAGILLANWLPPLSLPPLIATSILVGLLAIAWRNLRSSLLCFLLLLTAVTTFTVQTSILSPWDLRTLVGDQPCEATLRGVLTDTPYHRLYGEQQNPRTMAEIKVEALQREGELTPAHGMVTVTTTGLLPGSFFAGQPVEVQGVLRLPKGAAAPGLFDYRAYLQRQGIYYQLQCLSSNDWHLLQPNRGRPWALRFSDWARQTLALGLPEDEALRLLWAMTLGWKSALTGDISEPFMRSGTMHVFAISGLHIALITGVLVALLRVWQVPRRACGLIVIPLIWFYTGVTGWQASAIRSAVMWSVIIAGWLFARPSDLINSLAGAAFLILLWDPQQLFQASFQLSFLVVLSLALFMPALERIRGEVLRPDPLLPASLRPAWQTWGLQKARHLGAVVLTSLAAWLGSLPLTAYYFHLLTPVSLLANLVVVPLSSLALTANLASLLVGAWWPGLAELFNNSAWLWMWCMIGLSQWFAELPGGCMAIGIPGITAFLLYYGLLISAFAGWLFHPRWGPWSRAALAALTVAFLVEWHLDRSRVQLTILPLNGGHAAYLKPAQPQPNWLIDCGSASSVEMVTEPFLRVLGVNQLDNFLLTHGDVRHVGGAQSVYAGLSPRQVWLAPVRFRSPIYRQVRNEIVVSQQPLSAERGALAAPWTVLHPAPGDSFSQADDGAVVLQGRFCGATVLLLSDLGSSGQDLLLRRSAGLASDIVVAGLPQRGDPLVDPLLDAIQPRVIIIGDSDYPATSRASLHLRSRLAHRGVPVLYGSQAGTVTIRFESKGWIIEDMNGTRIRSGDCAARVTSPVPAAQPRSQPGE